MPADIFFVEFKVIHIDIRCISAFIHKVSYFKKIKTSYLSISLLAISALILSQCGGGGCEGADEKGGVWKDTVTTIVRPISESVIKSENQFGSYILKNGATEIKEKKKSLEINEVQNRR